MKMPERIETYRLVLREDTSAMFERWPPDKEVTQYLTWTPHISFEQEGMVCNCPAISMEGGNIRNRC